MDQAMLENHVSKLTSSKMNPNNINYRVLLRSKSSKLTRLTLGSQPYELSLKIGLGIYKILLGLSPSIELPSSFMNIVHTAIPKELAVIHKFELQSSHEL